MYVLLLCNGRFDGLTPLVSLSVNASAVFWEPEVDVGDAAPFQLQLSSQPNVSLSSIPFTSLTIHFAADIPPVIIRHSQEDPDSDIPAVQRVDLGHITVSPAPTESKEVETCLRWGSGTTIVFTGTVGSDLPMHISVCPSVITMAPSPH